MPICVQTARDQGEPAEILPSMIEKNLLVYYLMFIGTRAYHTFHVVLQIKQNGIIYENMYGGVTRFACVEEVLEFSDFVQNTYYFFNTPSARFLSFDYPFAFSKATLPHTYTPILPPYPPPAFGRSRQPDRLYLIHLRQLN